MEENFTPDVFSLQVDADNIPYLTEAAKWAKFLAVVGFVVCVIVLLVAIFLGPSFTSSISELDTEVPAGSSSLGNAILIFYVAIIVILYFFPLLYLYNFGSRLNTAIKHNDQASLNASFRNLKSCLKYLGILTIIILCVYAIGITFAVLGLSFLH
jgi:hypothetical protein